MPRYIDADALKSYLNEREYADMYYIEALFGIIDRQPAISPDEVRGVVHCGECIYPTERKPDFICPVSCIGLKPYDYCSHGVKMEASEDA